MRYPSLPLHDLDDPSSPDPLANSLTDRVPVATRSPSPPKRRLSSPAKSERSKRNFQSASPTPSAHGSIAFPVSPSRTVTEQTLSPWKIRVTVEAEHEDGEAAGQPMTRTIKVPLRGDSSPLGTGPAPRRGRQSTPSATTGKRSGTPVRRKSGSRTRSKRQSVTDLNIAPLGDDGDSDEWTGRKKSPRKKRPSRAQRAQSEQSDGIAADRSQIEIHEDEGVYVEAETEQRSVSPELREIDLNRVSVRPRSQSTKRKEIPQQISDKTEQLEPAKSIRNFSTNSAMSYPTPSPSGSVQASDELQLEADSLQQPEAFDTILESEEFTMIDLQSIPSARQFHTTPMEKSDGKNTMDRTGLGTPGKDTRATPQSKPQQQLSSMKKPTPIPSYLTTADDESELSSNVPSSPPVSINDMLSVPHQLTRVGERKVTPNICSSPSLPPAPRQAMKAPRSEQKKDLPTKVLRAGVALQDAVSSPTEQHPESSHSRQGQTPSSQHHDFLDGFSSGTKRELRAGLRFGEELARRQKSSPLSSATTSTPSANLESISQDKGNAFNIQPQVNLQVYRAQEPFQNSLFASDEDSQTKRDVSNTSRYEQKRDDSLLSRQFKSSKSSTESGPSNTQTPVTSSRGVDTAQLSQTARREHEWQLERKAISREIENASPSKVIVIDSEDDEDEEPHRTNDDGYPSQGKEVYRSEKTRAGARRHQNLEESKPGSAHSSRLGSGARNEIKQGPALGLTAAEGKAEILRTGGRVAEQATSFPKDGDEELMSEDEDDIWLQTAKDHSSSPRDNDFFTRTEQRRQRERAAEVITKPRRSLIPSPWKRGEEVNTSAVMSNADMSGLLWQKQQPEDNVKFGAGEIARQKVIAPRRHKRQVSGELDLERMLSSPVKHAVAGNAIDLMFDKSGDNSRQSELSEYNGSAGSENLSQAQGSFEEDAEISQDQSSPASSPPLPQKVPVNFNDSTLSAASVKKEATPPKQTQPERPNMAGHVLTPPRSAMKGTRPSFSPDESSSVEQPDIRRVVFSERSLYLNSDGEESSMSAKLDSPLPEPSISVAAVVDEDFVDEAVEKQEKRRSWLKWMWKGRCDESSNALEESSELRPQQRSTSRPEVDGANDEAWFDDDDEELEDQSEDKGDDSELNGAAWEPTRNALPSTHYQLQVSRREPSMPQPSGSPLSDDNAVHPPLPKATVKRAFQSSKQPTDNLNPSISAKSSTSSHQATTRRSDNTHKRPSHTATTATLQGLPSYLQTPSYPSLPTRNTLSPLPTSGSFTNTHFQTLHIIHAKSQRPRFHAPAYEEVRPSIVELVEKGWNLEVDEHKSGLDVFEWRFGVNEARVVERFMVEVEWDHVNLRLHQAGHVAEDLDWHTLRREMRKVHWDWDAEFLAEMLGRIVVGEVVRREEGSS